MAKSLFHLMRKHGGRYFIASKNQVFELKGFDKDIINFLAQFIFTNRQLEELFYRDYFMGLPVIHKPTNRIVFLNFRKEFDDDQETDTLISYETSFKMRDYEISGSYESYFRIEEEFYDEGNLFLLSFLVDIYNILYDNPEFEV